MTDRIEAAAGELRPLLQEFILWAPANAPGSDPELVGPVALWHRLIAREDVGLWKRGDLRTVLLERMPQVVEDPDAAADGMVGAIRAYLTFLSSTGRLSPGSATLPTLLAELEEIEDDFVDAMEDAIAERDWDEEEDELDGDEEDEGLGDFETFADEIGALPTIRLRPDSELAEAARGVTLIAQARDLALWVGTGRKVGEETLLGDDEVDEAVRTLGLPDAHNIWNLWNLAIDLEFLAPDGDDTVSVDSDTAAWPFDDDEDVLDAWLLGLHSLDYGDPELDDDDLTLALSGLTRALLIRLLLGGGERSLTDLRGELAEAVAEYDDLGPDAWAAAGDPLAPVIAWLGGYGMVTVEDDVVRLTPLGTEGMVHMLDDADIEIDARPAIDAMTALDLLSFSADMSEEEADEEFAAWLRLRDTPQAASELLAAAAEEESDALVRVQAASLVGALGEAAVPAWREALKEPSLRPYAATHLTQLEVEEAPEPTPEDTHWLILDMWTISAGLGRPEFVSSLHDIGPAQTLIELLDVIWKVPHPHVEELMEAIDDAHPDKQVGKAAKRALFKARSGR
ncbi:hypothetical protein [Microbispora sp. NPDC049125]|uniref:hypothetical protein n=1 Tax=Microbispora sp. NPDC049125 TaxID=3154929 RepID=UPI0034657F6B